jgi:hypothetical protein
VDPDFNNLSAVWKTLSPSGVKESDYNPTNQPVACPDYTAGAWEVNPTSALPTLGQQHTFGAQATSGSSASATTSGGSASGQASATSSPGAAPESIKQVKGMGVALAGAMAVFAWL